MTAAAMLSQVAEPKRTRRGFRRSMGSPEEGTKAPRHEGTKRETNQARVRIRDFRRRVAWGTRGVFRRSMGSPEEGTKAPRHEGTKRETNQARVRMREFSRRVASGRPSLSVSM